MITLFLVAGGLALAPVAADTANALDTDVVNGEVAARLDEYLARIVPFGFSGAVLVARDGEVVLNRGYGMADQNAAIPNNATMIFSIGSITKQFTAAAIMKLEMAGLLNTHDPIDQYFRGAPTDKSAITIHHLLTHTSGLTDAVGFDYDIAYRDSTVRTILDAPLLFEPGEAFSYGNANYSLLAAIVEMVSGQPYETYLRRQLFQPAGMEFTGYRLPDWNERVVAHWYAEGIDWGTPLEKPYPFWNVIGNGEILSTTGDMYRWHLALGGDTILSEEAKEKMYTSELKYYAYGWDVRQTEFGTLIQHNGGSGAGSSADFRRYVDADVVVITVCNRSYGNLPLCEVIRSAITSLIFGGRVDTPPAFGPADPDDLKSYEGTYVLPTGGRITSSLEQGQLILSTGDQDAIDALVAPDHAESAVARELNRRTREVLEGALVGDYTPLRDAVSARGPTGEAFISDAESRYRWHAYADMLLNRVQQITGALRRVNALGSAPSTVKAWGTTTAIALEGELDTVVVLVAWRNDRIWRITPVVDPLLANLRLRRVSSSSFAGYDLGTARNVDVVFRVGADGVASGLRLRAAGTSIEATRLR